MTEVTGKLLKYNGKGFANRSKKLANNNLGAKLHTADQTEA